MSIHYSATWTAIPDNLSISQLMQHGVENTHPEKVIYEEATTGKTASYGFFHRRVRQTAYNLRQALFLRPGDIVSISASSCIDYILTAHAVWWAGGVVSLINNTLHVDEITHALDLIKPRILIVDSTLYAKIPAIKEASHCAREPNKMKIFTIGSEASTDWPPLPMVNLLPNESGLELHNPIRANNFDARKTCAAILLSSGTTGASKAVMLSHHNLVAACFQLRSDNPQNWRGSQREIFFPPLSHVYALYVCFTMNLWLGSYVCLMPRFDLELYCRLMQDRSATLARIVPAVAKMLSESPIVGKYKYPKLEYFSCSAAPLHVRNLTIWTIFPEGSMLISGPYL
jgi:acyl-CoA synthetase (AMP-forming)/AMP-acid ligase II